MAFDPNQHMMQLKGKDYLQVAWRLVWFREDHPDWCIDPQLVEHDADHAIFRAVIIDENGIQKCAGHGSESKKDFGDFLEKAETKAVGRALAMLGYGTQFAADELDEGERIVDTPIDRTPKTEEKANEEEKAKEEQKQTLGLDSMRKLIFDNLSKTPEILRTYEAKYGIGLSNIDMISAGRIIHNMKEKGVFKESAS